MRVRAKAQTSVDWHRTLSNMSATVRLRGTLHERKNASSRHSDSGCIEISRDGAWHTVDKFYQPKVVLLCSEIKSVCLSTCVPGSVPPSPLSPGDRNVGFAVRRADCNSLLRGALPPIGDHLYYNFRYRLSQKLRRANRDDAKLKTLKFQYFMQKIADIGY
jgi:hypothetical protein